MMQKKPDLYNTKSFKSVPHSMFYKQIQRVDVLFYYLKRARLYQPISKHLETVAKEKNLFNRQKTD